MVKGWEGDTKLRYIFRSDGNAVKPISQVYLNELDGAVPRVSPNNLRDDPF